MRVRFVLLALLTAVLLGFAPGAAAQGNNGRAILLVPGGRGAPDPYLDVDYIAWSDAVASASGTVTSTDRQAAAYAIKWAKDNSYWAALTYYHIPLGDFNASRIPLKNTTGSSATFNNITSSNYAATGSTGGYNLGSTRYVSNGSWAPGSTGAIFAYVRGTYTYSTAITLFGAVNTGTTQLTTMQQSAATTLTFRYGATSSFTETSSAGFSAGLYTLARISATDAKAYRGSTQIGTLTSNITAAPIAHFVGARNNVGSPDQYMPSTTYLQAFGVGTGATWTAAQVTLLNADVVAVLALVTRT